jgi:hypothetical protein
MKKTLATLATVAIAVGAFAQGKVTFGNDAAHLIVFGDSPGLLASASGQNFASMAGQAIPQLGTTANTLNLFSASLWASNPGGQLIQVAAQSPVGIAGNPDGRLANQTVTLPAPMAAGSQQFQIRVWETSGQNYDAALAGGYMVGLTPVFTATSGSFAYSFLTTSANWSGPIVVQAVPEPSTFVLAGLGLASLLLFRRRK